MTKPSKGILVAAILSFGAYWFYIVISSEGNLDITKGLVISVFATGILLIRWRRYIKIEGDRIVLRNLFKTRTINKVELIEVKIKSGSILLIRTNGIRHNIMTNWFRQEDVVFLKDYFKKLQVELSSSET